MPYTKKFRACFYLASESKTYSRRGVLRFAAHRGAFLNAAGLSGARPKAAGARPWQPGRMQRRGRQTAKDPVLVFCGGLC